MLIASRILAYGPEYSFVIGGETIDVDLSEVNKKLESIFTEDLKKADAC